MLAVVSVLLPLAEFQPKLAPFVALLAIGFVVGVFGHITKSRTVIAVGIALIFLGTVVLPLILFGNPY
jgi:hypothetical protein